MEVGLSLGSNLGDRLQNLQNAKAMIASQPGIQLLAQSPVYETEPVKVLPDFKALNFLNAVLIIKTLIPLSQLLPAFQFFEQKMGRRPDGLAARPRPIDVDIIYADNLQVREPHLVIPHPHWPERRFVVQPLGDVRPDLKITGQTQTVAEIMAGLSDPHKVTVFAKKW